MSSERIRSFVSTQPVDEIRSVRGSIDFLNSRSSSVNRVRDLGRSLN